jgi:capsular polysaccharide biosynthesis protein/Mrp family chromosome partitioning ATPase
MTLLEIWQILRRRWWVIAATAVVAAGTALLYSSIQTPTYQARADLVVLPSRADYGLNMYLEARMRTFRAVILSPPIAEAALAQAGLSQSPDELMGRTHVQLDPDEGRIVIEVDDASAQQAAQLANALANQLAIWVEEFNSTQAGIDRIYVAMLSPARVPGSPSGPRTKLNTAAAAVLGIALGLPLAFLWDFVDDTLRDPIEAQTRLGTMVWPTLSDFSHSDVASLRDPEGEVAADFLRLYAQLRFTPREGSTQGWHTLALTGFSQEDIAPALLANLGTVVAQSGHKVLLVDAYFRRPALHEPLGIEPQAGLGELLQGRGQGKLLPVETAQRGLYLFPAGKTLSAAGQAVVMQQLARILPQINQAADIVFLRLPPVLETPAALFPAVEADAVLLVGQAGRTRRRDALRTLRLLEGVQTRVLGLALWR